MNMNTKDFFNVLFDEGEHTSFGKHKEATKVYPVSSFGSYTHWVNLFCINPLHPTKDLNPYEAYHHEDKPRRCDKNVVVYRNILIEMDTIALDLQLNLIRDMGMPYSAVTFSGGKSYHFIISLQTPLSDEKTYRKLVERLHKALGGKTVVDRACKNPSRFSRFPNVPRHDKDQAIQTLVEVKARVANQTLTNWIDSKIGPEIEEQPKQKAYEATTNTKPFLNKVLSGFTLNFIMMGAVEGERNLSLFRAACDMAKCGYSEEEAFDRLSEPSGLDYKEVGRTIKSAYAKIRAED